MSTNPLGIFPFVQSIDVRFRDLDALGHINHTVYLTYFESARIAYYMQLLDVDSIHKVNIIVAEVTATFRKPAFHADPLAVGVRVSYIGTKSFVMEYLIARIDDGTLIATGRSVQVVYDYKSRQSVRVPDAFRERVSHIQGPLAAGNDTTAT